MQADHLQPRARRRHRPTRATPAAYAQIHPESQVVTAYKSHEHSQPHKRPRASPGGRRHKVRRLGDGHHRGFIRTRHRHSHRAFHKLCADGETQTWPQGCPHGAHRGKAAFSIQGSRPHNNNGQRL